jgi:hypothetical protein
VDNLTYSTGMALFIVLCFAAYGLWRALTDDSDDDIIDRARKISDARAHQEAQWIAAGCWYGPKKDPLRNEEGEAR